MWSAEERAEGLEYMHPKPSSHSGRIVGKQEVIRMGTGSVPSRHLVRESSTEKIRAIREALLLR